MKLGNYFAKFKHLPEEGITLLKLEDSEGKVIADVAKYKKTNQYPHYDRETGRKAVLEKALSQSTLTREERGAIWNAYLNRTVPTNIVKITFQEGNSTVNVTIDGRDPENTIVGASFAEFKDAGSPTLLATVYNALLSGMGVTSETPKTQS